MGVWGYGNFESDSAMDVLAVWINRMIESIREVFTYVSQHTLYDNYGESDIVTNVDILGTLFKEYQIYPDLELDEVRQWKQEYLDSFDRIAAKRSDFEAIEFAKNRRPIVEKTFNRLLDIMAKIIKEAESNIDNNVQ